MPSLSLTDKKLRYAAADLTALDKAAVLLALVAQYDPDAKQDATTANNALQHVITHVARRRNGKAEAKHT